MVSNPKGLMDNSSITPDPLVYKKPDTRNSLLQFSEELDFRQKTIVCELGADKLNLKATIPGIMLWSSIKNKQGHTEINERIKELYNTLRFSIPNSKLLL